MRRLQFERQSLGLSQQAIATLAGAPVSQNLVSGLERGRMVPTPEELQALARALKVTPPEDLLKDVTVLRSR